MSCTAPAKHRYLGGRGTGKGKRFLKKKEEKIWTEEDTPVPVTKLLTIKHCASLTRV